MKMISQILVLMLMADAAFVAQGLLRKKNMWKWICLYWIILTAKNAADFLANGGIA